VRNGWSVGNSSIRIADISGAERVDIRSMSSVPTVCAIAFMANAVARTDLGARVRRLPAQPASDGFKSLAQVVDLDVQAGHGVRSSAGDASLFQDGTQFRAMVGGDLSDAMACCNGSEGHRCTGIGKRGACRYELTSNR